MGINHCENPRNGAALKGLLTDIKRTTDQRKKNLYLDKGVGTLLDGYNQKDVLNISTFFFLPGTHCSFRSRLDFLLGHSMLGRSEDKRSALLSNLFLYELEDEGPTECQALILSFSKSKTNQEGRREIGVAIRHNNVEICPVDALAYYLFYRFHVIKEPFPNLSSRQSCCDICLVRGKSATTSITYRQQFQSMAQGSMGFPLQHYQETQR